MRSISVSSFFFCPHHTISKGFAAFHTYIIWSIWLVSAVMQDYVIVLAG